MVTYPEANAELIRRKWDQGQNRSLVLQTMCQWSQLSIQDRELFLVGLELEEGYLPLIHQYGFAEFRPAADRRLIIPAEGAMHRECTESTPSGAATSRDSRSRAAAVDTGSSAVGARTAPVRAEAAGTEAESATRQQSRRLELGSLIDEDSRELNLYFPQFTRVFYDYSRKMWGRQGWLQPLKWLPMRFDVGFYYDDEPLALPIIVASPIQRDAPHQWKQMRSGVQFYSLCYTFAPDGTLARGRDPDVAPEALRQAVLWLIKYLFWSRFGFWPGADVGHDPAEIERLTRPDDPCPTHTWRRYGDCCRPGILMKLQARSALRFGINPGRRIRASHV